MEKPLGKRPGSFLYKETCAENPTVLFLGIYPYVKKKNKRPAQECSEQI